MDDKSKLRGRDMAAPMDAIELDGVRYTLAFTNKAARIAEDVYEQQYGLDVGYADILSALSRFKYKAVMAIFYGALIAGGAEMSWEAFDATFKLDSIPGIKERILRGVTEALPRPTAEDDKETP